MAGQHDSNYRSKIRHLDLGMSKALVRATMGAAPRDRQVMRSTGLTMEEWYYGSWQLSFENGKLESVNKY